MIEEMSLLQKFLLHCQRSSANILLDSRVRTLEIESLYTGSELCAMHESLYPSKMPNPVPEATNLSHKANDVSSHDGRGGKEVLTNNPMA
jgi:hypothetical protein